MGNNGTATTGHVGRLLWKLREDRGLTQADVGVRAGLDTRLLAAAELNPAAHFPPQTMTKVCEVLDLRSSLGDADRVFLMEASAAMLEANRATVHATPAAERGLEHSPEPAADACSKPEPTPLTKSYTSVGLLLRALRLERRIPVLDLAVLACMPEEVIEAAEIAGPIAPHLTERILHALDEAFPLSAEQREFFRDEVELSKPWAGKRAGDREAGVPPPDVGKNDARVVFDQAAHNGDRTHPGNQVIDPLTGRFERGD